MIDNEKKRIRKKTLRTKIIVYSVIVLVSLIIALNVFLYFRINDIRIITEGLLFGFAWLFVSIVFLFFIVSKISEPIIKLTNDMQQIANGNLNIEINVNSNDEVGQLEESLKKIHSILRKQIQNIKVMIDEQKKGNIDYSLNAEEFSGDYRVLADVILELASFGMKDQLTGIPNRRSFDNRLELEWNRAIREKEPISFLMLDIDKFKNYNDTFGHQQGDVALKTVAQTIKNSLNRSFDMAARWGGEEFAVLLPNTGMNGALKVGERIRTSMEKTVVPCADPYGKMVTISIGVSSLIPSKDFLISGFIELADNGLYKAKEAGRNKVMLGEVKLI